MTGVGIGSHEFLGWFFIFYLVANGGCVAGSFTGQRAVVWCG